MSDEPPRPSAGIGDLSAGTFELVARALNVAYYDWWAGSDEINMSPALAELFGFDTSSWSVSRHRSLIHPDDWPIVDASLRRYFKSRDERHELAYRVMSPDGAYRWWFARNVVERDADGRVVRLIGAVTDITEAREREAENRALIARQAASIEVLKTISASPDDPQPVFDLIARHARALCGAAQVSVTEYDGALLHMRARDGWDGDAALNYAAQHWPQPAGANSLAGRAALSGRVEHIRDVTQDADYGGSAVELARTLGTRSAMGVPLLRDGRAIGAIVLRRTEVGGFDDGEVALVESFAEQAVIAISSATSRRELRARTAELAERNTAYAEQIDHQSATIDVLKAMSASPGDPQPVIDLIAVRARDVCGAYGVTVYEYDGDLLHRRASTGVSDDPAAHKRMRAQYPAPASRTSHIGRVILDREIVHVRDHAADDFGAQLLQLGVMARSSVNVPLLRDGVAVGALAMGNREAGGFSESQFALLQTFAEQALIAIRSAETFRALEARTTELAVQVAHQEATIDVLKVMSSSTSDTQPVFDIILSRAIALSGAKTGGIFGLEAGLMHPWAMLGFDPEAEAEFRKNFPVAPSERGVMSRAILQRRTLYARDYHAENPNAPQYTRDLGYNSLVAVPLLREGAAIGVLTVQHTSAEAFSAGHVALLETFAEQAVIAIGSVATFRQLQERTAELAARNSDFAERIDQQAATIDVLKVMSASPDDTQPVFDQIVQRAQELCGSTVAALFEYDGELVHYRAYSNGTFRSVAEHAASGPVGAAYAALWPMAPSRTAISCWAILDRQVIHIRDRDAIAGLDPAIRTQNNRSLLVIPLLRDDMVLGSILLASAEVGGFTDSQLELLKIFAEQAVIAIGSVATYRALRERTSELQRSVEYQAATIDVLKVMSSSTSDTQPVFDVILRHAMKLSDAVFGAFFEYDGELAHVRATIGYEDDRLAGLSRHFPRRPSRITVAERALLDGQVVYVRDYAADPELGEVAHSMRFGSVVAVPLMRDGATIGAISWASTRVDGFSPAHIELLKTFAEQAVIAIGTTATFRALQERTAELAYQIKHQAAMIDVLKAIAASDTDIDPVLDTILHRAMDLCGGMAGSVFTYDGEIMDLRRAVAGFIPAATSAHHNSQWPKAPGRVLVVDRALLEARTINSPDLWAEPGIPNESLAMGHRSTLAVPMIRDGKPIGILSIVHKDVAAFNDAQVAVVETFAEQAVIAMRSAETLSALAARNADFAVQVAHQAATIDVLKVMSSSSGDTEPVFDIILRRALDLTGSPFGFVYDVNDGTMSVRAVRGVAPEALVEFERDFPKPADRSFLAGRVALDARTLHIPDITEVQGLVARSRRLGYLAYLGVPLIRDGAVVGVFSLGHPAANAYTAAQVALLETFAEQAVIAVGSVATFRALQERTAELTRSVGELQALEETMRAVNASLDRETVLATIIARAVALGEAAEGTIYEYDAVEDVFLPRASAGMEEARVDALRDRRIRMGETHVGRSAALRAPVAVADVQRDPGVPEAATILAGIHAALAVPLLREDRVVGGLVIRRRSESEFAPSTVTLMQTFAAQSVLAIENARLFDEVQARTRELTESFDNLRRTQDRLIQTEKLASLGQLTAGIAHEIKNPLNFVNNFAALSVELLDELGEALEPAPLEAATREEVGELTTMLKGNLEKVVAHGKRADGIVKNMLLHSRASGSERREVDFNATVEEALNLAFHGARAEKPGFNITLARSYDPAAGNAALFPQDFTRVLLNLIGNGFYAATKRKAEAPEGFEPTLTVSTEARADEVVVKVRDNGTGMPETVKARLFEPFFTTKPAGEGTGLGLSISHDIVVKQHRGTIAVASEPGTFTEFTVIVPRGAA